MTFAPETLRAELGTGLLCFPVTHAREDFGFDEGAYREHIAWLSSHPVSGVFAAAGTGEFPALTPTEVGQVVRAAVAASARPVVAPAGYGTAQAVAMARDAEAAGAAGVFLLPAYLSALPPAALGTHLRAVCAATGLGVIVQLRSNGAPGFGAVGGLDEQCRNLIGFSGGADLMRTVHMRLHARVPAPGGLLAVTALPDLEPLVTTYASAIFNFAPRFALDFFTAVRSRDAPAVQRKLEEFVAPYLEIRERRAGYAVPAVKAGLSAVGRPAGPVRPPLTDLTATEFGELAALIEKANLA
jgi:5-dehydro-4-deoxyglucarate dehydratase